MRSRIFAGVWVVWRGECSSGESGFEFDRRSVRHRLQHVPKTLDNGAGKRWVLAGVLWIGLAGGAAAAEGVALSEQPGKVRVEVNGELSPSTCMKARRTSISTRSSGRRVADDTQLPMVRDSKGRPTTIPSSVLWFSHGASRGGFLAEARSREDVHDRLVEVKSGREPE